MRTAKSILFLIVAAAVAFGGTVESADTQPTAQGASMSVPAEAAQPDRRVIAGIMVGSWIPLDEAGDVLGNKLELGIYGGGRINGWGADLVISMRFGDPKRRYIVIDDEGWPETTGHFGGVQLSLMLSRRVVRLGPYEAEIQGGIGWDAIDVISDAMSIHAFSQSVGISQSLISKNNRQIAGLLVRYHWAAFDTNGGTDLSGNSLSVNLLVGYPIFTFQW